MNTAEAEFQGQIAQLERDHGDLAAQIKNLKDLPKVRVAVAAAEPASIETRWGWLFWPCFLGGLLAGAGLARALRRREMTRLASLPDEAAMVEFLRVKALGVVPVLPALARPQD